jgi:hypothetical protein
MVATGNASQLQDKKLIECGQIVMRAADFLSQMSPNIRTLESLLEQTNEVHEIDACKKNSCFGYLSCSQVSTKT